MADISKKLTLKYCGARSLEDCEVIAESSADVIGFVFAESKRKVTPQQVKRWSAVLPERMKKAGVFQDQPITEVVNAARMSGMNIIQCHGSEEPHQLLQLKKQSGLIIFKALKGNRDLVMSMKKYEGSADGYIVDSVKDSAFGGTGIAFDWSVVPEAVKEANRQKVPLLVAGGISAGNAASLLSYSPDGIDVSSGIEDEEKKCRSRIQLLERVIREYEKCERAR
ncbi:phosphoribosylanthranilate isomerase [Fictibacillus iocasae]|uniref:N-(5'-phosphoribosyl)anthranilate isomerase n=1 Tax=Fictibacillus iocasae TaxID=2715437 RepID=A0ABW2NN18_9BACL